MEQRPEAQPRAGPKQQLTMEEYYDEAEGQWRALAAELRATRDALATPAGLGPTHTDRVIDLQNALVDRLGASEWKNTGARVAVVAAPPAFRRVLLAASDEIVATNEALSPILARFLHQGQRRPDLEEVLLAARALQGVASFLLRSTKLYKQQGPRDHLQPRLCDASVAIMDTGGLLFDLITSGKVFRVFGDRANAREPTEEHERGLRHMADYLDGMRYAGWQGGGLERLRATTHSPAAMLACLRRLLREPPSIDWGLGFVHHIIMSSTLFSEERAALEVDRQLLTATVDHLESGLQRVASTAVTLGPPKKLGAFKSAAQALVALENLRRIGDLGAVLLERATRSPDLLNNVAAILDACLADPPAGGVSSGDGYVWAEAATACLHLLAVVLMLSNSPCEPMVAGQLLGFLRRAVATVTVLEEKGAPPEFLDEGTGAALCSLERILEGLVGEGSLVSNGSARGDTAFLGSVLRGHGMEAMQSLEGLLRLAARAAGRATEMGMRDVAIRTARMNLVPLLFGHGLAGEVLPLVDSADGLAAISGIVDSVVKLGLVLAALPPSNFADQANKIRAGLMDVTIAFMGQVTVMSSGPPQVQSAAVRRTQALALAVCNAEAAITPLQTVPAVTNGRHALLSGLTRQPEVFSLVVNSQAGGPAMARMLEFFSERWLRCVKAASTGPGGKETAAALARLGILTQVARCVELHCREEHSFQEGVLTGIMDLVSVACASSEVETVAGGCSRLAAKHGPAAERKTAFWAELAREVTVPLAAELTAKAAAEAQSATAVQLEVDIAEALATRRCARLACTNIAGPTEAALPLGKRCAGCRLVRYCGAACQKADWKAHKAACRELQARRSAPAPEGPA